MTANWEPVDDLSRGVSTMVNNLPSDLMPNNAGAGEWELTLENMEIGVANSTSFGLDEELAGLGARHAEVLEGERAAGLPEHRAAHEAGPAGDVVPRGGCRVRLRREGAAERAADSSEDGERGGAGAAGSGGDRHGKPLALSATLNSTQLVTKVSNADQIDAYICKIGRAHV